MFDVHYENVHCCILDARFFTLKKKHTHTYDDIDINNNYLTRK